MQAEENLEQLTQFYEDHSAILTLLVDHNHLDALELSLEQIKSLLPRREKTLALITLDELVFSFSDLSTGVKVSWKI